MNKLAIALSAALALGASATASAQDGLITFNGEVLATTCEVSFPGVGGTAKDPVITLPTVSTTSLGAAGATAGRTPFSVQIGTAATPCTVGTDVAVELNPNSNASITGGRLNNILTGEATGVQVQLIDGNGAPIALNDGAPWTSARTTFTAGVATLNFAGEYYASAAAGAGKVSSTVEYTIDYK